MTDDGFLDWRLEAVIELELRWNISPSAAKTFLREQGVVDDD